MNISEIRIVMTGPSAHEDAAQLADHLEFELRADVDVLDRHVVRVGIVSGEEGGSCVSDALKSIAEAVDGIK